MKNSNIKIIILFLLSINVQFSFSQIIENYEGTPFTMNIIKGGTNDLSTLSVINNPFKNGINTSNKVCRLLRDKDGIPSCGFSVTKTVDFTTNKYVHIKVYKNRISQVKFKVEGGSGGVIELSSNTPQTKTNQWEDIVFDFSSLTGEYTKITFIPDFRDPVGLGNDVNMYFDDFIINNDPNAATYITELYQNSYKLYKDIRQPNGVYLDAVALNGAGPKPAAIVASGIGLMSLCISDAMFNKTGDNVNWEATSSQVITTTQAFIDFKNNGISNASGMFPRYFKWDTGEQDGTWSGEFSTIDNAIFAIGLHMCRNYFSTNATIVSNVNILLEAMDYTKAIYPTRIAMILDESGNNGTAFTDPFNEYMLVAWLAKNANSSNSGYAKSQTFWNTYFANPTTAPFPRPFYFGYITLSDSNDNLSSFIPQFCYYFANIFKKDTNYMNYFNNWLNSDKLFATKEGATNSHEWGLGAGEVPGGGYSADKIYDNPNKIVSPHIVAGFSPIYSNTKADLLSLYNNGNGSAVYSLPSDISKKVLWRYSRNNNSLRTPYIQAIDYSTLLFGLASLPENLGVDWFSNYNWPLDIRPLSADKFAINTKIEIYPNPFVDSITILNNQKRILEISVIDLTGKIVFLSNTNEEIKTLNLPKELHSGIYILQLKNDDNEYQRIKIIKN